MPTLVGTVGAVRERTRQDGTKVLNRDGNPQFVLTLKNKRYPQNGMPLTDQSGEFTVGLEVGETVTVSYTKKPIPNSSNFYRDITSIVHGDNGTGTIGEDDEQFSQPAQEPRSPAQPARAIQPANDPRQLSIEVQGARSLAHELLRQEIAMDKINLSDIDAVEQFLLVHTSLLMRVQNKVKESFSDHA